jgi:hypothetical protein
MNQLAAALLAAVAAAEAEYDRVATQDDDNSKPCM